MSRFEQEFALVPEGARWTAVLVCLAVTALLGGIFLMPGFVEGDAKAVLIVSPFFLLSLIGVAFLGAFVLLVGYVFGDAKRRGMNHVLWTLLAIFIPNAIGIILYFILRDPIPVPCPRAACRPGRATPSARAAGRRCERPAPSAARRSSRAGRTARAAALACSRRERLRLPPPPGHDAGMTLAGPEEPQPRRSRARASRPRARGAVELDEQDALPGAELEPAVGDVHGLGGAEEERLGVGVAVGALIRGTPGRR